MTGAVERRPHQLRALANLQAAFERTDRAQLHWACGTGKTLVGRWLAEDIAARSTLVVVPSLALVAQTLAEWQDAGGWLFDPLVVCSDHSTADAWRIDKSWWSEHGVKVTTVPDRAVEFLRRRSERPRVVFSTYHSAPVIAAAARRSAHTFDLMVCDEAHRLAGDPDERFRVVLDNMDMRARRRVFATATPIVTAPNDLRQTLSMDNVALFGPAADRLSFAKAIEQRLLCDYQVLVIDASGDAAGLGSGQVVPAALAAAAREGASRIITFHGRVAKARQFAAAADGLVLPDGRTVRASAVAGTDPTARRRAALADLAGGAADTVTVVANARCLAEGVDVPAVDGVIFGDPKTSDTDIVQAIGRALRPSPGKKRGLIVLPVVADGTAESEDALTFGAYGAVWAVLRALRDMDPRMAAELEALREERPSGWRGGARDGSRLLRFDLDGVDLATLAGRVVDPTRADAAWTRMLVVLRAWIAEHGHSAVPSGARPGGKALGQWVFAQRRGYAAGGLSIEQVRTLSSVPGWSWTTNGAWWRADHAAVVAIAATAGALDLTNPVLAGARLPHRGGSLQLDVGRWCAQQHVGYRAGDLTQDQIDQCEEIPGWLWDAGVPVRDLRMVDALAEWVDKHGDANVPADAHWGSAPLGAFVAALRRRRVTGRLYGPLAAMVAEVTPVKGAEGALDWQPNETRWRLNLIALYQFQARSGGLDIPENHVEDLPDFASPLYDWCTRHRHQHRHGRLDPERAKILEQVPGWSWERARKARVVVGIGARQHGTRLGYAAGCICDECTAANTAYEAERQRRRAAGEATTDLVDATKARAHLRILEAQLGKRFRPAVQQVTGLNKKTVDEAINGTRGRIHPETSAAFLALTAQQIRDHIAANPSSRDELPAGPTMELLAELIDAGWPKAWISRELGAGGKSLQIGKGGSDVVRRETAEAVSTLRATIGDRVPPPRGWRAKLPTLAELVASEAGGGADLEQAS